MVAAMTRWLLGLVVAGLAMGLMLSEAAHAQEAAGEWHGALTGPAGPIRVGVAIEPDPQGGLAGRLTSPDQTTAATPLAEVKAEAGRLSFTIPAVHGRFEGRWDAAAQTWIGTYTQNGSELLVLARGPVPARHRPQTPQPPYPYRAEPVAFDSAPGVRLAGTLTLPPGKGPFPVAVMITGSGPQDRDETIFEHKPFAVIADALARRGVAALRYDDRGVGQSTGRFAGATGDDFAADAAAAVAFLRRRPDIDPARVGLIGHSEGGMVAPMLAAQDRRIAFIVLMAAPAASGPAMMAAQREAAFRMAGVSPQAISRIVARNRRIDEAVIAAPDGAHAEAEVLRLMQEDPGGGAAPAASIEAGVATFASPGYRWIVAHDSAGVLAQVRCPVLALNGGKDFQVVAALHLPAMRQALKADGDATVVELPGLNHLFQTADTGAFGEYARIEETIAPSALSTIVDWVAVKTRR